MEPQKKSSQQKIPASQKVAIKLTDVQKSFQVGTNLTPVLKGISLEFYESEMAIIFGPSGCGKSTLLNTVTGLEPPTSGSVEIRGENFYEKNENQRAIFRNQNYGIVYQNAFWIRTLNALENVAMPLYLGGKGEKEALAKARETITEIGLEEFCEYIPTELSGGQQQRLGVARALVSDPEIVVADEPTGNVDSLAGKDLMELFKKISEEKGKTVIMVTHNMEHLTYADRRISMRDGYVEGIYDSSLDDMVEVAAPGFFRPRKKGKNKENKEETPEEKARS